ncbi:MAG: hypothetical protein UU95_C0005G0038 [Parcubacteria group bacterium GW2011_GWC2_42_12]|nr:MAG: hypothetical protein UU95_C0005G0038 [Parcubacteria group bacterium GW2011_GWC2_42_12]
MTKSREEYSENLESQFRSMERVFNKIMADFENREFSKSSRERLDEVYNFFQICYHLREWIQKDSKVDQIVKDKLPTFEKDNSPIQFLICRDLCNKTKHSILDKIKGHKPNDVNTKIVPYGGAIFSVPFKDLDEANKKGETLHVKEEEGIFMGNYFVEFRNNKYDLKGTVQGCMHVWKEFFEKNDLLLPRSTPYKIV